MNVIIIFNKKKHQINIHKLDSILSIKNEINNLIFNEKYELKDIEIYFENKLLDDNDYCDKHNIIENSILNVHLKKKGGGIMKKILWVIGCIIIILIPFFILPTGINTSGSSFVAVVLSKVKDGFSRYLVCELKYKTLVKRFGSLINFLKYIFFIMATYVIITIGCVTACLLVKGNDIEDNPNKICSPYYVGSLTGLILTSIYFLIYFLLRYSEKILSPLENLAKGNFITNTLLLPIITGLKNLISNFKFVFAYIMPFFGIAVKSFHIMIDNMFPEMLLMIEKISKVGCSPDGLKNILKNIKSKDFEKLNEAMKNQQNNSINQNNQSNSNNSNNKPSNNEFVNSRLYNIQFNNGIIDNSKYEDELNALRNSVKEIKNPLCKDSDGGCCNRNMMEVIANAFYDILEKNPIVGEKAKTYNMYFGVNLACIGMYEYVLNNDDIVIDFNDKSIVETKILLRQIFDQKKNIFKFDKNGKKNNNGLEILTEIEKIVVSSDEYLIELMKNNDFEKIKKRIFDHVHKDDLDPSNPASRQKIEEIYQKIATLEARNQDYALLTESKYETGNTIEKIFIKKIFINIICNLFQTTKTTEDIINEIGGLNELMDIMKCGSASGVIISIIYIITVIILMICGFVGLY